MSFSGLLNQIATVTRLTDQIVDSVSIAASVSVDRQLAEAAYLDVILTNSAGGGYFTIVGYVDGVFTGETLSGLTDGTTRTQSRFSSVSAITTGGFTAGTAVIAARSLEGSPLYQTKTLYTNMRCRRYKKQFTQYTFAPGESETDRYVVMSDANHPLQRGDRITISGVVDQARTHSIPIRGSSSVHHYETEIQRIL